MSQPAALVLLITLFYLNLFLLVLISVQYSGQLCCFKMCFSSKTEIEIEKSVDPTADGNVHVDNRNFWINLIEKERGGKTDGAKRPKHRRSPPKPLSVASSEVFRVLVLL